MRQNRGSDCLMVNHRGHVSVSRALPPGVMPPHLYGAEDFWVETGKATLAAELVWGCVGGCMLTDRT